MTTAAASAAKTPSMWEDFIDILTSPARVFERRRASGFGSQLFIIAILATIISAASMPLMRPMRERQMEVQLDQMRKRGMTEDQIAAGKGFAEKIGTVGAVAGTLIGIPIAVLVVSLVVWGVASAAGAKLDFRRAGVITTYSMVPTILAMILGAALLAVLDADSLPLIQQPTVAPVLLLGRDASPVMAAIATRFGLGDIWSLVITAIGVSVLGNVTRARGFIVAATPWLLGTGVAVFIGMRAAAALAG